MSGFVPGGVSIESVRLLATTNMTKEEFLAAVRSWSCCSCCCCCWFKGVLFLSSMTKEEFLAAVICRFDSSEICHASVPGGTSI